MARIPIIYTWRLKLRPFTRDDAADVQRLAGDADVARFIPDMPHPYPDGVAEQWISSHAQRAFKDEDVIFAIVRRDTDELIGAIELGMERLQARGSLGYWIGKPYWGNGFATEAARAMLRFGFAHLGLHRISATHIAGNAASGRVMQKIGMTREGVRRQHVKLREGFVDDVVYGIVRGEMPASALTAAFTCVYVQSEPVAALTA